MEVGVLNPYHIVSTIRNPSMFFGRTRLVKIAYSAVADKRPLSLVGIRSIGKSSFLDYIMLPTTLQQSNRDLSKHIFVLINMDEHLQKTDEDFFRFVNQQFIEKCEGQMNLSLVDKNEQEQDKFRSILVAIEKLGFYPVLLLDTFDSITRNKKLNSNFLSFLRAQAEYRRVSYVIASVATLDEICRDITEGSPLFNLFAEERIGALTREEAQELITVPAEREGCPFTTSEVEWILSAAGRHPYFILHACYFIFEEKTTKQSDGIELNKIEKQVYKALQPSFVDMWKYFSEEQREYLKGNVQQAEEHKDDLDALCESSLFRTYVATTYKATAFVTAVHEAAVTVITIDMLEEALKHIRRGDLTVLGECELQSLPLVTTRLLDTPAPAAIQKGRVIKEVLFEALKSLQGLEPHSDSQKDWMSYNILYYYYFKDLTHGVVQGRIGIYENTYFRRLKKALRELYNAVLTGKQ